MNSVTNAMAQPHSSAVSVSAPRKLRRRSSRLASRQSSKLMRSKSFIAVCPPNTTVAALLLHNRAHGQAGRDHQRRAVIVNLIAFGVFTVAAALQRIGAGYGPGQQVLHLRLKPWKQRAAPRQQELMKVFRGRFGGKVEFQGSVE